MHSAFRYWVVILLAALASVSMGQAAAAQQNQAKETQAKGKDLSDRSVRVIQSFAWQIMPKEYKTPSGTVIKVQDEDPSKFFVPTEDARRVIIAARRSANAEICDLEDHQAANYTIMMNTERDSKKWSKEQLLYIHQLHLFTVMWLTGNISFEGEKVRTKEQASKAIDEGIEEAEKAHKCSDEDRLKVRDSIEAYVKAYNAKKS